MSGQSTNQNSFADALATAASQDECNALAKVRGDARLRFESSGLPSRRDEEWKYTSLAQLNKETFFFGGGSSSDELDFLEPLLHPDAVNLVFLDGYLATGETGLADLPPGLAIHSLRDFVKQSKDATFLLENLDAGPLTDLNLALLTDGVVIDIEAKAQIGTPIHVIHVATGVADKEEARLLTSVRTIVRVGSQAEATILESTFGLGDETYFMNDLSQFSLASGARLQHLRFQELSRHGLEVAQSYASVERDAHFRSFVLTAGQGMVRNNLNVRLGGGGASTRFDGVYLVGNHSHVDNHTTVEHAVPNASSQQYYKGLLSGDGRAVFNGKVIVKAGANGTAASQLNKNILLSDKAEIDTKPELRIDANDVKCSHGAAVGQLTEDEIFYCQARGIPRTRAVTMLCRAFIEELLLDVESLDYLELVEPTLERFLDNTAGLEPVPNS